MTAISRGARRRVASGRTEPQISRRGTWAGVAVCLSRGATLVRPAKRSPEETSPRSCMAGATISRAGAAAGRQTLDGE